MLVNILPVGKFSSKIAKIGRETQILG